MFLHVLGVVALEERVQIDAVLVPVGTTSGFEVLGLGRTRAQHAQVQGQADLHLGTDLSGRLDTHAVGQQEVVRGGHRQANVIVAGSVMAVAVAQPRAAPRLVQGRPLVDAVDLLEQGHRVVREAQGRVAIDPAALVLQGLWEVPVVHGG